MNAERLSYPDPEEELIERQYANRPHLRRIYELVIDAAKECGNIVIQPRKTYVSLVTPRRTFARIHTTTRWRVDVALRLEGVRGGGRLLPSRTYEAMPVQLGLMSTTDVDDEVRRLLCRAYRENCW
ncbi:MAG TPA: DUF5655 domain-containing protein [Thermoanaerobaculia bacterium]|nr:DUF5655 domain-containing protein [Thermoanaerobaculia bacterium]